MEKTYTVRQAVEITGVKAYVLRYWEDELELHIGRNEMGHRYYTGYDIQLFMNVKELKKRGLQLRAIKDLVPQMVQTVPDNDVYRLTIPEEEVQEPETAEALTEPEDDPHREKILEFQTILERLIAQEMQSKNEDEERCRSLDLAIRRQQLARKEAAAADAVRKPGRRHKNT